MFLTLIIKMGVISRVQALALWVLAVATLSLRGVVEGGHALSNSDLDLHDKGEVLDIVEQGRNNRSIREESQVQVHTPSGDDIELPEGYSMYEIPKDMAHHPIELNVFVQVINILELDEQNEIIHLDIVFTVNWSDFKILYFNNQENPGITHKTILNLTQNEIKSEKLTLNNPNILDKIWTPNLFIDNLLSVKQPAVMSRPVTIKFIPRVGYIEYITRISLKVNWEMDFHYYPADTQFCDFIIRGFSYSQKHLRLSWSGHGAFLEDLTLPSFDVRIDWTKKMNWTARNNNHDPDDDDEIFDLLTFRISARRSLSYHFVQTYMASTFYIIITTLCFLLPTRLAEARVGIAMTTLLTLTAIFRPLGKESTPIVSYVKAIDVWMVGCICFVFLTLAQFTFHIWATNSREERKICEQGMRLRRFSLPAPKEAMTTRNLTPVTVQGTKMEYWGDLSEKFAFPIFIAIFAIYTAIYWIWLLNKSDYFNWDVDPRWNNVNVKNTN